MNDTDASEHRHAWDAIPWVVNGSASADDRSLVERHIRRCTDCHDELDFQSCLHRGIGVSTGEAMPNADAALQRLWARLDALPADDLSEAGTRAPHSRRGRTGPGWARWLVAAVVVQAVGLLALSGLLWSRAGNLPLAAATVEPPAYQTLSQPSGLPGRATLRMVASPGLPMGELPALLARCGVEIVQSSGDGSILALAPRPGARRTTAESLNLLRADPGVRLAEPIVADGETPP